MPKQNDKITSDFDVHREKIFVSWLIKFQDWKVYKFCRIGFTFKKKTGTLKANNFNVRQSKQIIIFINPSDRAGYDTRSIFKRSLTGLNSEFSFSKTSCLTKAEEPSLPYHFPIDGGRMIGFIPFPRVLVLCEMQSVSSTYKRIIEYIFIENNPWYTLARILSPY